MHFKDQLWLDFQAKVDVKNAFSTIASWPQLQSRLQLGFLFFGAILRKMEGQCIDAQPSQDKLCQVKWEIVCISFMHHFHPQIGTIQDVLPAIDDMTLCVQHTLVEVEAIQVKGHRANTQGSEPNANDWPQCPEEMQCTNVYANRDQ